MGSPVICIIKCGLCCPGSGFWCNVICLVGDFCPDYLLARGYFCFGSTFVLGGGSVAREYLCITYQLGWAGWQVYIMEQSEGSVIKCNPRTGGKPPPGIAVPVLHRSGRKLVRQ